jgi:ABC-type glycerol-3-phosphate transport system permease component
MRTNNSAFEIINGKFHINFRWLLVYTIMLALVAFTALPLVYLVSTAFKPFEELFLFPPRFFVRRPTLKSRPAGKTLCHKTIYLYIYGFFIRENP